MKSRRARKAIQLGLVIALMFMFTGCRQAINILPQTLYFIDGTGDSAQVWRMEKDGVTRSQITNENTGVDGFSASPMDGAIALVSNNKLQLIKPENQSHQLIADGGLVNSVDHPSYTSQVSNPKFSPGGETLAYSLNGIHLYDLSTGVDNHILPNPAIVNGTAQDYAKGAYSPGHWSPDGSRLLVVISYYEGCMLAVLETNIEKDLIPLEVDGATGCQTAWSEDGQFVLAANPYFTGTQSGLWQFNAGTGQLTLSITRDDELQIANFAGWPYQSAEGILYFFHTKINDLPPPEGIRMNLVRIDSVTLQPIPTSTADYLIRTALWTPAGDGVLVVGDHNGTGRQLLLIDLASGTSRVLINEADQVRNLVWGP